MTCPKCGLESLADARACECGYEFAPSDTAKARSAIKPIGWSLSSVIAVIAAIFGYNYLTVTNPINQAIASDPRNVGIVVWAHYDTFVKPSGLVYDLRSLSSNTSMA